jgi:hypothetical protein
MEKQELQARVFLGSFGVISLLLGALFTLDYAGLVDAGKPWHYWPLILIGLGVPLLTAPRSDDEGGWGLILTSVGTLLILPKLRLAGPILLILVGLWLVFMAWVRWDKPPQGSAADAPTEPGPRS